MISVEQYLMGRITIDKLTPEQMGNMNTLIPKINDLLEKYGKPTSVNSGYRSPADQARINPKAPRSMHLVCAAVDLADRDHNLRHWCLTHLNVLEDLGLYMEDVAHTPSWIHLQCIPPKSGHRIFIP